MFGKKKQADSSGGEPTVAKVKPLKIEKLRGPKPIPGPVEKILTSNYKMDATLVPILKILMRKRPQTERALDCRIFDPAEAEASGILVKDYDSFDGHPELILYEGWFDDGSKKVEMAEKKKLISDVPLFTLEEIQQKIEALSEPGSSVFFYQARGPAVGGPLGRGATIVELNPNYPGKGQKKYIIYTANVVGMEPVANKQKSFDSDNKKEKGREIARWIKDAHHKRMY